MGPGRVARESHRYGSAPAGVHPPGAHTQHHLRTLDRLAAAAVGPSRRHKSMTTSRIGCEQQTRTLPLAGTRWEPCRTARRTTLVTGCSYADEGMSESYNSQQPVSGTTTHDEE
jgi:hypothetical protein